MKYAKSAVEKIKKKEYKQKYQTKKILNNRQISRKRGKKNEESRK